MGKKEKQLALGGSLLLLGGMSTLAAAYYGPKELAKDYLPPPILSFIIKNFIDQQNEVHFRTDKTTHIDKFDLKEHGVTREENIPYIAPDGSEQSFHIMYVGNFNKDKPTIIAHHGIKGHWLECTNTMNLPNYNEYRRMESLQKLSEHGYNVIAYSAPGYGKSTGKPSEASYICAASEFAKYLHEHKHIADKNTLIFGNSMGAAKALILSEKLIENHKFHSPLIVLSTAFDSALNIAKQRMPYLDNLDDIWREKIDNVARIVKLDPERTRVVFVTAGNDDIVPAENSRRLIKCAEEHGLQITHKEVAGEHSTWDTSIIIDEIIRTLPPRTPLPKKLLSEIIELGIKPIEQARITYNNRLIT